MAQLRLAMAQVNPTVGDLEGNSDLVITYTRRAAEAGAHLVVFPEMVLTGYPVEDLALRNAFIAASITALHTLAQRLADEDLGHIPVAVGYLDRHHSPTAPGAVARPAGAPHNAVALLHQGKPVFTSAKHHLPNYGVFDEARHFVPGNTLPVVRLHSVDVAFVICEDLWQEGGPWLRSAKPKPACSSCSTVPRMSVANATYAWSCAPGGPGKPRPPWPMSTSSGGQDELGL